jgi:hypothetical protein
MIYNNLGRFLRGLSDVKLLSDCVFSHWETSKQIYECYDVETLLFDSEIFGCCKVYYCNSILLLHRYYNFIFTWTFWPSQQFFSISVMSLLSFLALAILQSWVTGPASYPWNLEGSGFFMLWFTPLGWWLSPGYQCLPQCL